MIPVYVIQAAMRAAGEVVRMDLLRRDVIRAAFAQLLSEGTDALDDLPSLEVDYARELADEPTFAEALAALEQYNARRQPA